MDFKSFTKIARFSRDIIISEKIDGTSACIGISPEGDFFVGSRNRWLTPSNDNFGFASWAQSNLDELMKLGPGYHYGEWWGCGIQRGYNLKEKKFSLFNTSRWDKENVPSCCSIVPVLYKGPFDTNIIHETLESLKEKGSLASPGFMNPEGIIIFHTASNVFFKKTIEKDEIPKGKIGENS